MPLFNGTVYAVTTDGDTVYAGGNFTAVDGVTGYEGLAKFNLVTGAVDTSWKPEAGGSLTALALSPDKTFIITGARGGWAKYLAKFLVNNNSVQSFVTVSDQVAAIVADGNYIYVTRAGIYQNATATSVQGTFSRPSILKIDVTGNSGQGSIDETFVPVPGGDGGGPSQGALAQDANYLYIGGNFGYWNNVRQNRIVKINKTDAAIASDWSTGAGFDNTVTGLTMGSNGSLYAVGEFDTYNWASTGPVVKLNTQGTRDAGFSSTINGERTLPWASGRGVATYNGAVYVGTTTGVFKSNDLNNFVKDSAFLTDTGFSPNREIRVFMIGSNLLVTASASTTYKGSAAGFDWAISTTTAEEVSLISSTPVLVPMVVSEATVVRRQLLAMLLSTSELESVSGVARNQWKRLLMVYTSPGKKKVVVSFRVQAGSSPGRFLASIDSAAAYSISKMVIVKNGGQSFIIERADFPTLSGMDITVT